MTEDVRIDRLVLDLPGLSVAEARELALQLGEGLSAAGAGEYATLSVALETHPGEPKDRLAARILAQLLRGIG
jgi:hypothetical protein